MVVNGHSVTANQFQLSWDGNPICALVDRNLSAGVSGFGLVREALSDLADNLYPEGVWIEVTDPNEWRFREIGESNV